MNKETSNQMYSDKLLHAGLQGTVVKYFVDRGYGFIKCNDNTVLDDVYVHFPQIIKNESLPNNGEGQRKKLFHGQSVVFDLYMTARGHVAKNVMASKLDRGLEDGE